MAETLTFENTQEVTSVDNLSAEEQDSLEVGKTMQQAEDTRLAGKYENAQELEKAYIELEKKLGEKSEPDSANESSDEQESEAKTDKEAPEATVLDELWDQASSGKEYSKETLEKLNKMSTTDLANMHLQYRQGNQQANQPQDLSPQDVEQLQAVVGGKENYNNMMQWAQNNLQKQEVDMFDAVMERGDPLSAFFAVRSLAYRYNDASGYDGKMLTGAPPKSSGDTFKSQAQVVEAMGDSRYDTDPAYRQGIMDKLERSNLKF